MSAALFDIYIDNLLGVGSKAGVGRRMDALLPVRLYARGAICSLSAKCDRYAGDSHVLFDARNSKSAFVLTNSKTSIRRGYIH